MQVTDEMQLQAKALADPSRFRLFRHIVEAADPVGVAELTELLGFNHNAIRQHLTVLVEAGLVAEADEQRTVRGRPRKEYTGRQDALSAFRSVSGSYQRLAELLLELNSADDGPYEVGYRAGLAEAGSVSDGPSGSEVTLAAAVSRLAGQLATDGFEPAARAGGALALMNCPFADVASKNQGIVCELHRGLIDGHLAAHSSGLSGDLSPKDPRRAGCRVVVGRRTEAH